MDENLNGDFDKIELGTDNSVANGIAAQIKMKFWPDEVESFKNSVTVLIQPTTIRNGRESSAATINVGSYTPKKKDEIIEFVEQLLEGKHMSKYMK
jgi:hypothetical protein